MKIKSIFTHSKREKVQKLSMHQQRAFFLRKGKIVFLSKEDGLTYCAEINGTNIVRYKDAI